MESDTTVPGDKVHDPVETPAGKRKSTLVLRVARRSNKNPVIFALKRTCTRAFVGQSVF